MGSYGSNRRSTTLRFSLAQFEMHRARASSSVRFYFLTFLDSCVRYECMSTMLFIVVS